MQERVGGGGDVLEDTSFAPEKGVSHVRLVALCVEVAEVAVLEHRVRVLLTRLVRAQDDGAQIEVGSVGVDQAKRVARELRVV